MSTGCGCVICRKPMQKAGTGYTIGSPFGHVTVMTSLRNAGRCDKLPIQKSPWTLPVTPKNQKLKLEYCERNLVLLRKTLTDTRGLQAMNDLTLWLNRIDWIKANKL